jgi:transformation/transcription domain-associated protein
MVIFIKFLEYHPTDFDALFSLIDSMINEDFRLTQPLLAYIFQHIISNSIEYCKTIMLRSLEVYASKGASQKTKTFLLHYIINPIIAMDVTSTKSPRLIDKAIIESIHTNIWKVSLGFPNDDLTQPGVDYTRMEVLQLTATLIKHDHSVLHGIIKVAFCLEDIISKYAAHVVIGYFIAHFKTPTKTI